MTPTRVDVFGVPAVSTRSRARREVRGAGAAVLGSLALAARRSRPLSRDALAFALWPDRDESSARRALSDALYRLRRSIGDVIDTDAVSVALRQPVTIDIVLFDVLAASNDPVDWERAIELAGRGEFLSGVDADWADDVRRSIEGTLRRLLRSAWAERRATGAHVDALALARRWVTVAAYDDAAQQAVIESLARVDGTAAALAEYERFAAQLADDLGVAPGPAARGLAEQLRNELSASGDQPQAATGTRPFVGRVAERGRLLGLLDRSLTEAAGLAVVLADAGMGKTRLLDEVAAAARWRGVAIGRGRGNELDRAEGHGALIEAVTELTPLLRRQQLSDLVDDVWLRQLAALAPIPGEHDADVHVAEVHLPAAIGQTLVGLSRVTPLLVLLDDLHLASDDAWSALELVRAQLGAARVLIVVAARHHELRERAAPWQQVQRWDRAGVPVVLLDGLTSDEVGELLGRTDDDLADIHARSGGNPLVALALGAAPRDDTMATANAVAAAQLARLGDRQREVIGAAAVLGQEVDFAVWRALVDDDQLAVAAGALEVAGLLAATPTGYRFAHDTLRDATLAALGDEPRRALHRAALAAVRDTTPDDVAALLIHAEGAGDRDEIGHYALENGARAIDHCAFGHAATMFTRALDVIAPNDELARRTALVGRLRASKVLADQYLQQRDLDELIALVARRGGLAHADALRMCADHQISTGRFAEGLDTLEAAEAALSPAPPERVATTAIRAAIELLRASAHRALGRLDAAEQAAHRAHDGFAAAGDVAGTATAIDQLGGIAWSRSEFAVAAEHHAAAAALFAEVGAAASETRALNNLGSAQWGLGDIVAAAQTHDRAIRLCRALGDRQGEGDNVDNLGGVAWSMGDYHGAIEYYSRALAIRRDIDDPWGVSISLSNLGDAWRQLGEHALALELFEESLEVNRVAGVVRNDANTRQSIGLTLVDCGRYDDGRELLVRAAAAHRELGDRANEIAALGGLVTAFLATSDLAAAGDAAARMLALLQPDDRPMLAQLVHLRGAQVSTAAGDATSAFHHLALAATARAAATSQLAPTQRAAALANVPLHRETSAALAAVSTRITVLLAPAGRQAGKQPAPAERIAVTWTVMQPGDPPGTTAAGRRVVLDRLLTEAAAAGATATHDELAAALGVSRRTVIRDLEALAGDRTGAARLADGDARG